MTDLWVPDQGFDVLRLGSCLDRRSERGSECLTWIEVDHDNGRNHWGAVIEKALQQRPRNLLSAPYQAAYTSMPRQEEQRCSFGLIESTTGNTMWLAGVDGGSGQGEEAPRKGG